MRLVAAVAGVVLVVGCSSGLDGGSPAGGGGSGGGTGSGGSNGCGPPGNGSNPLSQVMIDAFVSAHNQARSGPLDPPPSPALPPVCWDAALADAAHGYLSRCPGSGALVPHNANRTEDYAALGGNAYVGENIYGSSGNTAGVAQAIALWMSEAPDYDYAANNIGDAGHYTQIVWRSSVRIGCAIVDCPAFTYHNTILCDYAPGGNINGQRPY
jgi:pathogenesis-related protein 1